MMRANNGDRLLVEFGGEEFTAGVQEADGNLTAAFKGARQRFRGIDTGKVNGQPVRVLKVEQSAYVPGMVLMTLEWAA